ncbi:hypothetical protein IJ596_03440 [bacterium]|nr:hypothetical protein [bacterium]
MGLKISSIRAGLLAASLALSATACKKAPAYKVMPKHYVPQKVMQNIDSLRNAGVNIINNPEYIHLGNDTLKLNTDFMLKPKSFMESADKALTKKYTDRVRGEMTVEYVAAPDVDAYILDAEHFDKYVNKTTIVRNNTLYTTDYTDTYLPVEHYAKINPKAKPYIDKDQSIFAPIRNFLKSIGFNKNNKN